MLWWEDLEVPIRRLVGVLETFLGQEREAWTVETCGHYDHISFDQFFSSRSAFRNAFCSVIEPDSCFGEADNVPAKPFCFAGADLMENVRVYHGCFGEESLGWGS